MKRGLVADHLQAFTTLHFPDKYTREANRLRHDPQDIDVHCAWTSTLAMPYTCLIGGPQLQPGNVKMTDCVGDWLGLGLVPGFASQTGSR